MSRHQATRRRSSCPISTGLELLGDRWSLLIVRDLLFAGFRTYKEFLGGEEGIATNILADRLSALEASGIVTSERDAEDGRKQIYRLTPKGVDLAPVILELGRWAVKHEKGVRRPEPLQAYEAARDEFLQQLRHRHLPEPASKPPPKRRAPSS
jgi:DNA-binding HxlR family transcriptional regulator